MPLRKVSPLYVRAAGELRENAGQWAAYCSEGHCAVLAGPGSGKTKTLTLKLARMLAEDVRHPAGIACITYSQECARELDRRLDKLGARESANLFVGTIHAFCMRHILIPYARLSPIAIPDPIVTATSGQTKAAYDDAVRRMGWRGRPPYSAMDIGVHRRVHLDEAADMNRANDLLTRLTHFYLEALRRGGLVDYDDQVLLGLRLVMEHDWCLRALAAKFPVLAVDEYQDLGHPLDYLVRRLVFDGGVRLFAVGDVDQSIYGFTGADGALLTAITERSDVEDITLELNYRSAAEIVQASQWALGEARPYRAHDADRRAVIEFHHCAHGAEAQAEKVVSELIPAALAAKEGRTLGDIAILYRTAEGGNAVAEALDAALVPYIRTDTAAPYRRVPLTSWIEDMAAWASGGWREAQPTLSGLTHRFSNFDQEASDRHAKTSAVASFLLEWRDRELTAYEFVRAIKRDLLGNLLRRELTLADQATELDRMMAALDVGGKLAATSIAQLGGRDGDDEHLNLLTLHSAKGCEYEVVIMIGLDQGAFPWANEEGRKLQESRRLFYVGLTRAMDEVHLVYSGSYTNFRGTFRLGPSLFVTELMTRIGAAAKAETAAG